MAATNFYIYRTNQYFCEQLPTAHATLADAIATAERYAERDSEYNPHHAQYSIEGREGIVWQSKPCCALAGVVQDTSRRTADRHPFTVIMTS